jgi:hypothetical protein
MVVSESEECPSFIYSDGRDPAKAPVSGLNMDTLATTFAIESVAGVMVSIVAFQAVDPGSIPGRRTLLFSFFFFAFLTSTTFIVHVPSPHPSVSPWRGLQHRRIAPLGKQNVYFFSAPLSTPEKGVPRKQKNRDKKLGSTET